eukprot:717724-Rhodomonas_salina.2
MAELREGKVEDILLWHAHTIHSQSVLLQLYSEAVSSYDDLPYAPTTTSHPMALRCKLWCASMT